MAVNVHRIMVKPPNKALIAYLTWVNPAVALVVLYCCSWTALDGTIEGLNGGAATGKPTIEDPFSMYFIGKGIFCSTSLFLFGIFLRSYLINTSLQREDQP